ncbi:GntR family transcriptional regulator [Anianabacter salinae]|uniref:GntR family transcriptional regulator n=1 Tax=Anianabacter salinae TaxID=2851023 RepID=UPI00225DDB6C|nr:GntR family transcriptional regulator [Anianabacter salinae]MBV0912226.1 GntR family transcriptional regulator [Anianabacter salinae]
MDDAAAKRIEDVLPLRPLRRAQLPTVADQAFEILQKSILTLEMAPQTRISEAEVANRLGVSRQPVREAFKRLAKLGFLEIRPQSGTTVSLISEAAVLRARYIRTALEIQTCRTACDKVSEAGLATLSALLDAQRVAVKDQDRTRFHALDDEFHREICVQSGVGYVWELIHDNKAHMDRVRMLSLSTSSQKLALAEHVDILNAITARAPDAAEKAIHSHLSRILTFIEELKATNHSWFTDAET